MDYKCPRCKTIVEIFDWDGECPNCNNGYYFGEYWDEDYEIESYYLVWENYK